MLLKSIHSLSHATALLPMMRPGISVIDKVPPYLYPSRPFISATTIIPFTKCTKRDIIGNAIGYMERLPKSKMTFSCVFLDASYRSQNRVISISHSIISKTLSPPIPRLQCFVILKKFHFFTLSNVCFAVDPIYFMPKIPKGKNAPKTKKATRTKYTQTRKLHRPPQTPAISKRPQGFLGAPHSDDEEEDHSHLNEEGEGDEGPGKGAAAHPGSRP